MEKCEIKFVYIKKNWIGWEGNEKIKKRNKKEKEKIKRGFKNNNKREWKKRGVCRGGRWGGYDEVENDVMIGRRGQRAPTLLSLSTFFFFLSESFPLLFFFYFSFYLSFFPLHLYISHTFYFFLLHINFV
jgi:hypothetical protein